MQSCLSAAERGVAGEDTGRSISSVEGAEEYTGGAEADGTRILTRQGVRIFIARRTVAQHRSLPTRQNYNMRSNK